MVPLISSSCLFVLYTFVCVLGYTNAWWHRRRNRSAEASSFTAGRVSHGTGLHGSGKDAE